MKRNVSLELSKRLLITIIVLLIYIAGRNIFLYGIDINAYNFAEFDSQDMLLSVLTGDRSKYTIFSLGVMPHLIASIIVNGIMSLLGRDTKKRISPKKIEKYVFVLTIVMSIFIAVSNSNDMMFVISTAIPKNYLKVIAISEMVIGEIIIHFLIEYNKKNGIGAQSPIVVVNIVDTVIRTIITNDLSELKPVFVLCIIMSTITLITENIIIKTPVQRVSINNEFADNSYIAYKFNPTGVMPLMFAISFFMIPQFAVKGLLLIYKDSEYLKDLLVKLSLNDTLGITLYLVIIILLSIILSFIMINPNDIADQLQRNGDSVVGIYAGTKTRSYLRLKLLLLSIFSGLLFSCMMGVSLYLSLIGVIQTKFATFPISVIMLVGSIHSLIKEIIIYKKFDSYSFFM